MFSHQQTLFQLARDYPIRVGFRPGSSGLELVALTATHAFIRWDGEHTVVIEASALLTLAATLRGIFLFDPPTRRHHSERDYSFPPSMLAETMEGEVPEEPVLFMRRIELPEDAWYLFSALVSVFPGLIILVISVLSTIYPRKRNTLDLLIGVTLWPELFLARMKVTCRIRKVTSILRFGNRRRRKRRCCTTKHSGVEPNGGAGIKKGD